MLYSLIAVFILTWGLVRFIYRYQHTKNILVTPNHRSSHEIPTPTGGGIAFAFSSLIMFVGLKYFDLIPLNNFLMLFIPGLVIATVGFVDDINPISAVFRLMLHFAIVLFIVSCLNGDIFFEFNLFGLFNKWIKYFFIIFYLCWLLNLYNFMDGIDGLAASQAIFVCSAAGIMYWLNNDLVLLSAPLTLVAAVSSFLIWNIPPAKIFMGDAGSGFLGISLGTLSLQAATIKSEYFVSWLILLAVFIIDATVTLIRRLIQGEQIFEAHRSHAYQHAAIFFKGHLPVTLSVAFMNIIWLLPIAILVGLNKIPAFLGLIVAYIPLIILAIYFKAGQKLKF